MFPGIAVFSLSVLLLVLAVAAVVSLRPWAPASQAPSLSVSPGVAGALGNAVEVAPAERLAVASAAVVASRSSSAETEPAAVSAPAGGEQPALGISPGRPVQVSDATSPADEPIPPPEPVATGPELPSTQPAPPQLVTGAGSGAPGGPETAVVGGGEPDSSCTGDEYVVTGTFEVEEAASEHAEGDILIQRLEGDGSESELRLEGDSADLEDLVSLLLSEGDCVQVKVEAAGEDAEEPALAGADVADHGGTLESAAP